MDAVTLLLQEAGVIKVVSEQELTNTSFNAIFARQEEFSNPKDRFKYVATVLQSWKDKSPILPEPGTSLCESCKHISLDKLCSTEGYIHSECYWALVASAEVSRCPMCVLMVNALREGYHEDFDMAIKLLHPLRNDLQVFLRAVPRERRCERANLEVLILNTAPFLPPGRLLITAAPDTVATNHGFVLHRPWDGPQKFAALERWLHVDDPPLDSALPMRLIDVSSFSNSANNGLCLVETKDLSSKGVSYVTLSYRWGDSNNLTTSSTSLKDRLRCILFKDMPRTIQDAVIVTSRLKVRYLWVDSLCIVQDNKEEWLREAEKMAEIYMNSYCTIAAHSADHADHGFLEKSLANPRLVQFDGDSEKLDELVQQEVFDGKNSPPVSNSGIEQSPSVPLETFSTLSTHFWVSQGSSVRLHVENSELSSRAWCLQEHLLSRRTIHFADDGAIYLESIEELQSIDGVREIRNQFRGPGIKAILRREDLSNRGHVESSLSRQAIFTKIYVDWYKIVEDYSRRSLTKSEDKIPALTGVIRQIHALTGDKCYMGVWAQRVAPCLLWLREKETLKLQTTYRAPSWSWAAYDGKVQFPMWNSRRDDTKLRIEFVDALFMSKADTSMDTSAGYFSGPSSLLLYGVKMLRNPSSLLSQEDGGTGLRFMDGQTGKPTWVQSTNWEQLTAETRFWTVHDDSGRRVGWASLDGEEREEIDGEEEMITCIAIASHTDDNPASGFVRGFLVLFVKFISSGVWLRVGMGQIRETALFERITPTNIGIL